VRLQDRVAVVTGAASGIGQGIAQAFAGEGAAVVIADRDAEGADATATAIVARGGRALACVGDVADAADATRFMATAVEHFDGLHVVVNSAGISGRCAFLDIDAETFERVLRVNVTGTLLCAQAAARIMVAHGYGRIINVASISGQRASLGRTAYGTSKGAVIQLTRQMALELGPRGVTANAIAPGPVDTAMALANHTAATRAAYAAAIPVGRYGQVSEMAEAALYLAGEGSAFVNGHVLNVDGGYAAAGING
jgi:NAD(P)-dependent dehydrogenase (short-subunit alcohol dehydrogenase family)